MVLMPHPITIRPATESDFESIYQFVNELQNKTFDRSKMRELFFTNLKNTTIIYLMACSDNKAIGYLSCHIQLLLHHGGQVAEIQEMFVKPGYRSLGVGKLLMDEVKNLSKKLEVLQLEVTTRVIREKAIQFYKRESFEDTHKKLVYYFK